MPDLQEMQVLNLEKVESMAINDISLTTGMRSNLLSLQSTVTLLDRTQERLSSGKKQKQALVPENSWIISFQAQGLMIRQHGFFVAG